jgi:hypothetical protein
MAVAHRHSAAGRVSTASVTSPLAFSRCSDRNTLPIVDGVAVAAVALAVAVLTLAVAVLAVAVAVLTLAVAVALR